jgi:hypothetical protein
MDDAELFDVFSVNNNPEPPRKTLTVTEDHKTKKPKKEGHNKEKDKRKPEDGETNAHRSQDAKKRRKEQQSNDDDQTSGTESYNIAKRPRKVAEQPVVVDSFETETDQIVPAAQGLQGAAITDHNIIIKKRVRPRSRKCKAYIFL